ncbi:type II toxin-antitoxin system HicB family antitoxin [Pseudorhizobium pelagicum]|uniref:CopG family transcriptional regulator n=1 Tax=Pseudorhizobium pelagicum TaxID=1509405 RepID=A0A922NZ03_9HYPH|nr:type II toxin-antitoxin system HicB family antitoxin [Pseudorhizobium pelagicum]KEQ03244.1 CopG family transcriptional regulator [Pseudorhizobium pelagicum]KEQ05186.1 CopG family transcriptional regulator [Pseudorhizobium pelagicum]
MRNYIGLIYKDADSDFGVSFPDFPGVVTAGTDLDDARHMAEEALALHVDGLLEDGEAIPEPSTLDAVMADPDNKDGVAILVSLKTESRKAVRINITLPEDVLKQIDAFAEAQGLTRSGFLARAAKHEMGAANNGGGNTKNHALSA